MFMILPYIYQYSKFGSKLPKHYKHIEYRILNLLSGEVPNILVGTFSNLLTVCRRTYIAGPHTIWCEAVGVGTQAAFYSWRRQS